jgi:hypothetical protein
MTEPNDDDLIHPETTDEAKWLKMTPETRDKLLAVYLEHNDECNKYQAADDRVTIGEAAILWLMDRVLDRWSMKKEPKSADVFAPSVALMRHKETGKVYVYICRGQMSGYKHIWSHEFDESKCCWIKDDEVEAYYDLDGK